MENIRPSSRKSVESVHCRQRQKEGRAGRQVDVSRWFRLHGAARNSFFGMRCKALGAQQPECTFGYMRIASTGQRGRSPEQRIYGSANSRVLRVPGVTAPVVTPAFFCLMTCWSGLGRDPKLSDVSRASGSINAHAIVPNCQRYRGQGRSNRIACSL